MSDNVNHPIHYTSHPSGVEAIDVTEHFNFNLGNVIKYVWRAGLKNGAEDLRKAAFYLDREIRRQGGEPFVSNATRDAAGILSRDAEAAHARVLQLEEELAVRDEMIRMLATARAEAPCPAQPWPYAEAGE